jgi:hypothetical protein
VFNVNRRKLVATVKRLSLTGGSVVFSKQAVPHGTFGEMTFETIYGHVKAEIEFLQMGADGLPSAQAFRFLSMDETSRERFEKAADQMQRAGFSDSKQTSKLTTFVSELISKLRPRSE